MLRAVRGISIAFLVVLACGPTSRSSPGDDDTGGADANGGGGDGGGGGSGGYTIYAHSDTILYSIDLANQTLTTVGPFNSPNHESMTDLAVGTDGTIYVISETYIYTADPTTAQLTELGPMSACGMQTVALTTTSSGQIWAGDYNGALCQIDVTASPPTIAAPITMGNGMALTGDFVGISDGTIFGTAYDLSGSGTETTKQSNVLVKIDLATGAVTQVGSTGFPELYGVAFQEGKVFGFTHDDTGRVITIDTTTGVGTLFGTFIDPSSGSGEGIAFAGAGVNALVQIF
ncbi:MAG TPA: hypothetical protein VHV78_00310 [Gemmatimonadaceae bacterium]|jgi:hypothetical protein|nr:hypothetical protein [Gemmatimonadaceae bacterium]